MTTNAMIFWSIIVMAASIWGILYAIRKQIEFMREQKKRHYKVRSIQTRECDDVINHCYELLEESRKQFPHIPR
jgi:hypothetical protein